MRKRNPDQLELLLVEDSADDAELIREAIAWEGLPCHMDVVQDGETAILAIDKIEADSSASCPDIILLDLNLPRKMGQEVLTRVKGSGRFGKTAVVIVTSSEAPAERAHAKDMGVEYFRKPSSLEELMLLGKLIRKVFENSRGAAA